jgi:hypothetical protein
MSDQISREELARVFAAMAMMFGQPEPNEAAEELVRRINVVPENHFQNNQFVEQDQKAPAQDQKASSQEQKALEKKNFVKSIISSPSGSNNVIAVFYGKGKRLIVNRNGTSKLVWSGTARDPRFVNMAWNQIVKIVAAEMRFACSESERVPVYSTIERIVRNNFDYDEEMIQMTIIQMYQSARPCAFCNYIYGLEQPELDFEHEYARENCLNCNIKICSNSDHRCVVSCDRCSGIFTHQTPITEHTSCSVNSNLCTEAFTISPNLLGNNYELTLRHEESMAQRPIIYNEHKALQLYEIKQVAPGDCAVCTNNVKLITSRNCICKEPTICIECFHNITATNSGIFTCPCCKG